MIYRVVLGCVFSINFLFAQEKIPPWIIIPCDEVPDSIYLQDQIDIDIEEEYDQSGFEHRFTYCVKFQLDSMTSITGPTGHQVTIVEVPREPDSTEIVDVRISTFNLNLPSDGSSFLSVYALDYGSTIWTDRYSQTFGISIGPMPDGMSGRNFLIHGNRTYGYINQYISPWFGPLSTTDKNRTLLNINLYPNPSSSWITVEWNKGDELVAQLEIFDGLGRRIHQQAIENRNDQIQIATSTLIAGNYWLLLKDEDGRVVAREQFQKVD